MQDKKIAVLCIHGILGTPEHFRFILPFVPSNWSIHRILLQGHGGGVKDFSAASMAAWKQQVKNALRELSKTNDSIVIAAHSMGTLFAIQEAIEQPTNKIEALFLLNLPLRVHIRPRLLKTTWRVFRGKIPPGDTWSLAAQNAYGIDRDLHILRYLGWIPRYLELFSEIRNTRKLLPRLCTPCQAYLSSGDELVSLKTGKLLEKSAYITLKYLKTSGHYYYSSEDLKLLTEDFHALTEKLSKKK